MPFLLDAKIVIAIASSAVFDMRAEDIIFRRDGEEAYRRFQSENVNEPLKIGVAFPFVRRLLHLNSIYVDEQPFEVIVLSRNDPDSGRRFFRSCQHYGLKISRGAFLTGGLLYPYISAFNASLFLSANRDDVTKAIEAGLPAGLVLPTTYQDDANDKQLRIAFDFDGVIADDESETVYNTTGQVAAFHQYEMERHLTPHQPGPLADLFQRLGRFQRLERQKAMADKSYQQALRIAIVTARDAPANERVVTTLKTWDVEVDEVFFLGGIEKHRILKVLNPHIFFDDQMGHLSAASGLTPSIHVPFGIANLQRKNEDAPAVQHDEGHE